jgi:hypothetical protein
MCERKITEHSDFKTDLGSEKEMANTLHKLYCCSQHSLLLLGMCDVDIRHHPDSSALWIMSHKMFIDTSVVSFRNFSQGKAENTFYSSMKMKDANNGERQGFEMFPNLNADVSVNS